MNNITNGAFEPKKVTPKIAKEQEKQNIIQQTTLKRTVVNE